MSRTLPTSVGRGVTITDAAHACKALCHEALEHYWKENSPFTIVNVTGAITYLEPQSKDSTWRCSASIEIEENDTSKVLPALFISGGLGESSEAAILAALQQFQEAFLGIRLSQKYFLSEGQWTQSRPQQLPQNRPGTKNEWHSCFHAEWGAYYSQDT